MTDTDRLEGPYEGYHLAQVNIGRTTGPLDAPHMADFTDNLGRINGLGKVSPGFVWLLEGDDAEAGLKPRRCTYLFFGACSAEGSWDGFIDNLAGIFSGSRAAICALIRPDEFDFAVKALREWATRPDAAFWYAVSYAEGIKP